MWLNALTANPYQKNRLVILVIIYGYPLFNRC